MNTLRKFFGNSLNTIFVIVAVLTIFGAINITAAFLILLLCVLFYIEDHLRKIHATLNKSEK